MKIFSSLGMLEIEEQHCKAKRLSVICLIENAARKASEIILNDVKKKGYNTAAVFCSKGFNSADGFGVARHLRKNNVKVKCFTTCESSEFKENTRLMYEKYILSGGEVQKIDDFKPENFDFCVDAVLGTGLKSPLRQNEQRAVDIINSLESFVYSIDVPTGINSDTGEVYSAVKADKTIVFTAFKPLHFLAPSYEYCGELTLCDIGIDEKILENYTTKLFTYTQSSVLLPKRKKSTHKGDYGRLLIIAGSEGFSGAAHLCSQAALFTGVGLIELCVPKSIYEVCASKADSVMVTPLDDKNGKLTISCMQELLEKLKKADACLIGPGLSINDDIIEIVLQVVKNAKKPLIIDADGINAIAKHIDILKNNCTDIILTPHLGELKRLIAINENLYKGEDIISSAKKIAACLNATLVLKQNRTVVATKEGLCYINSCGGPHMAKGGSGDVLSGIIAGLAVQGQNSIDASSKGVYIHSAAGDFALKNQSEYTLNPCDIIFNIKNVLRKE